MREVKSLSHTRWECKSHSFHPQVSSSCLLWSVTERYIKGKSAIHIARTYVGRKQNFVGQHFWARGYFVSTVGRDETQIREYIQNQEKADQRLDQLHLM